MELTNVKGIQREYNVFLKEERSNLRERKVFVIDYNSVTVNYLIRQKVERWQLFPA